MPVLHAGSESGDVRGVAAREYAELMPIVPIEGKIAGNAGQIFGGSGTDARDAGPRVAHVRVLAMDGFAARPILRGEHDDCEVRAPGADAEVLDRRRTRAIDVVLDRLDLRGRWIFFYYGQSFCPLVPAADVS